VQLKNREVFLARVPLENLMSIKLPVKTSYQVAKLANKIQGQLKVIDDVRNGLIKNHGTQDEKNQWKVEPGSENMERFVLEFEELMDQDVEIIFDVIKLPTKIAGTCDACHHNMDREFEIEASVLMALEKFVEVA